VVVAQQVSNEFGGLHRGVFGRAARGLSQGCSRVVVGRDQPRPSRIACSTSPLESLPDERPERDRFHQF
jgi:hypothetical protein